MPKSTRSKTKHVGEMMPTSQKLDVIDSWLQKMLDRFPQKGQLTTSEIEDWHKDLAVFSGDAIEYAFEVHRRNAIFFPLNGQIIDLCVSYDPPGTRVVSTSRCDDECKKRHMQGYGENPARGLHDMTRLYELVCRKIQAETRKPDNRFTDEEIDGLLADLDKMRGLVPEFRREGVA